MLNNFAPLHYNNFLERLSFLSQVPKILRLQVYTMRPFMENWLGEWKWLCL